MATVWDRLQATLRAAMNAWRGGSEWITQQAMVEGLTEQEKKRLERYDLLWKYYLGDHKRFLKVAANQPNDNVIINHCARVIDDGVSFLFGKELRWELQEGEETDAEKLLASAWRSREHKMSLLGDIALNGGVCGDFYLQLQPSQGEAPPRLINLYPSIVFPECNPDDVDELWAYQIRYRAGTTMQRVIWSLESPDEAQDADKETAQAHASYNQMEGLPVWVFWTEQLKGSRWEVVKEKQMWPHPWPNLIHGKNLPNPNSFHGRSDLEDADLNDTINLVASNTNRVLRLHAHPKPWGRMTNVDELDIDPGKMPLFKNENAELKYLEMAGKGGEFSRDFLSRMTADFYKVMRVPEMDPEIMSLGAQSGFALRVLYSPLLQKTETKRNSYGAAIVEANRRILEMMDKGTDHRVTLHWQDPLPLDESARVENDQFELDYNLASKETVRTRRGLDHTTEEERIGTQKTGEKNIGALLLKSFEQGAQDA